MRVILLRGKLLCRLQTDNHGSCNFLVGHLCRLKYTWAFDQTLLDTRNHRETVRDLVFN